MHEFSLAQNILEIVEESIQSHGATRVSEVVLEIGTLSGVEISALDMALESLKPGSVLAGAIIRNEIVQARARCKNCGTEFEPEDLFTACPQCGSYGPEVLLGKELKVKEIIAE